MKKKAIEKIPFLKLGRIIDKKDVEYVAVTAIKNIGHERHLFLEVYKNDEKRKNIPVVRIAMTKKDHGTWFPESGRWSRQRVTGGDYCSNSLIWDESDERITKAENILIQENVLSDPTDLKHIRDFAKNIKLYRPEKWWDYIDRKQEQITTQERNTRECRVLQRRQKALEDRGKATMELPEKRIIEYADEELFQRLHYLYYKKRGSRVTVACSKCGGVSDEKWRTGESYESQFEKVVQEPRKGAYGTCPLCGARGKYIPQGKARSSCEERKYLFLGQRYKETGMVFRYIEIEKRWELELTAGACGLEMMGSREVLEGVEVARAYFEKGKKLQVDYHKHNNYTGNDFWDDRNLCGLQNIQIKAGIIMPETYENIKGTIFQYSALYEYQKKVGRLNPVEYLERYLQTPQIEMLVKMNLIKVVNELVKCCYGIVADENANRVDTLLGIRKERVKLLTKSQGDKGLISVMQMEKRMGQTWTEEQVKNLAEIGVNRAELEAALQYMSIQKLLNRIAKYAGCEYGTECNTAESKLKHTALIYFDYLGMRQRLGYELKNSIYQYPRDLMGEHDKMVMEINKIEQNKRLKEVSEKFPMIRKHYRQLRKKYFYEDETFLIRPARSAEEIVMEGRFLHHCVGGNNYLEKHNREENIILLLRQKETPEVPYITVEIIHNSLQIRQWYGKNDRKPEEDKMEQWLSAYLTRLKCENRLETGEESQQRLA